MYKPNLFHLSSQISSYSLHSWLLSSICRITVQRVFVHLLLTSRCRDWEAPPLSLNSPLGASAPFQGRHFHMGHYKCITYTFGNRRVWIWKKEPVPSVNILSKLYQVFNLYGFKFKASKMQFETANPTPSTDWHLTIASPQKPTWKRHIRFTELNSNLRPECVSPGCISKVVELEFQHIVGFYLCGVSTRGKLLQFVFYSQAAYCIFQEKMWILFCSSKFFMKKPVNHCKNIAVNFVQFTV